MQALCPTRSASHRRDYASGGRRVTVSACRICRRSGHSIEQLEARSRGGRARRGHRDELCGLRPAVTVGLEHGVLAQSRFTQRASSGPRGTGRGRGAQLHCLWSSQAVVTPYTDC